MLPQHKLISSIGASQNVHQSTNNKLTSLSIHTGKAYQTENLNLEHNVKLNWSDYQILTF